MWETIIKQLITEVVVPELSNYIKEYHKREGVFPSEIELKNKALETTERIQKEGRAFLQQVQERKENETNPTSIQS